MLKDLFSVYNHTPKLHFPIVIYGMGQNLTEGTYTYTGSLLHLSKISTKVVVLIYLMKTNPVVHDVWKS